MAHRYDNPAIRDERRAFSDMTFEAEDARLNAALEHYERNRPGFGGAEYGRDENYRPGYHRGGSRFGFFGGPDGALHGPASKAMEYGQRSLDEQDFDPDYLSWRQQQMARHDLDYMEWRREQVRRYDDDYWKFRAERREDFHQRFQDWRTQRDAEPAAGEASATISDQHPR